MYHSIAELETLILHGVDLVYVNFSCPKKHRSDTKSSADWNENAVAVVENMYSSDGNIFAMRIVLGFFRGLVSTVADLELFRSTTTPWCTMNNDLLFSMYSTSTSTCTSSS